MHKLRCIFHSILSKCLIMVIIVKKFNKIIIYYTYLFFTIYIYIILDQT